MSEDLRYKALEEYVSTGSPNQKECAGNWSVAIGLQAVDALKPSAYLLSLALEHIERKISSNEVGRRLENYYAQESVKNAALKTRTVEADLVSYRIQEVLNEERFNFSPAGIKKIHGTLFRDVLKNAGHFRTFNISKKEWVLDGNSVAYGSADALEELLIYDFSLEKKYDYSELSAFESIEHIARFIAGLWQIHAFGEGNTRTISVFLIKYLRSFGFQINSESFLRHSWFFRNALVRSQYEKILKDVHRTFEPLLRFLYSAVFGIPADLRNRTLHIRWKQLLNDNPEA